MSTLEFVTKSDGGAGKEGVRWVLLGPGSEVRAVLWD